MTESGLDKRPRKQPKETKNKFVLFWRKLKKNVFFAFLLDVVVIVGSALMLSLIIKTFLIRSFFIPSGSMLETLKIDDRIVVNELVPAVAPLHHGDIIVFKDPGGWLTSVETPTKSNFWNDTVDEFLGIFGLTAPDSSQHLVKRVIGLPGDTVECCSPNGKLMINGVEIDETYLPKGMEPSLKDFKVTVPADSYWVMGDNRADSEDSRYHLDLPSKGFVAKRYVVGQAFVITWPQKHWTWLGSYPDVFKNVPNK